MSYKTEQISSYLEKVEAVYPWKAGAGIQYKIPGSFIKLLLDYNYTYNNMKETLNDRHDIHGGIESNLTKNWVIRGGLFTLFDYRSKDADWIDPVGKWNQFFFTLGAGYRQKDFEFNIAFLTSAYSSGIIKTQYLNGGVTFNY